MADEQVAQDGVGLAKGTKVGKYDIVERRGMGGQAIVYKAHDPLLDRFVALKQISSHLASDAKFLERFRKEAQILAKLGNEQESIVTIHELIDDEQGLFIVMEFLAGHSLETVLADTNGPSEPKATLQILWRLAAALHAVHAAGIIHRDLKPSNIIVGEGLRAKITDFGVAASISGQTSMVLGTTKYMAPELFEGDRAVDGRADEYSLGFIAYEMLAGRPKFNEIFADIVRDRHSEALRWMKWHGNLSVHAPDLSEVSPSVPGPLSLIVSKMMQKDPDKRFETMEQLGRAIKMAFSPRAKATGRRAVRRPVAVAATKLKPDDSGSPLVPRDEGDELELAGEGLATAPIPSARLGRKLLVFLLPLVVLAVVGLAGWGVYNLVQERSRSRAISETASKAYRAASDALKKALRSYEPKQFETAAKNYKKVLEHYPTSIEATMASVMLPVAEAYVAMGKAEACVAKGEGALAEQQWERAVSKENQAGSRIKQVQSSVSSDSPLYRWAQESRDYVRNFRGYYIATRTYTEAVVKAKAASAARQYDEIRLIFQQLRQEVTLTTGQEDAVKELLATADLAEFQGKLQAKILQADDLLKQDKFLEAEQAYQQAQELLQSDEASILPGEEAKKVGRSIAGKLGRLTSNRTLRDALGAVDKARAGGDKQMLILALRTLDRIRPDDKIKGEIKTLQSAVALAKGREHKAAGAMDKAREMFKQALVHDPKNQEAQQELTMLARADEHAVLVSAGDAQFAQTQWALALAKYAEAAKIKTTDALTQKMKECRFWVALGKADQLRTAGKYAEAVPAYEAARKEKPSAAQLIDARLRAMRADEAYRKLMTEAQAALKREQWVKAREFANQAMKIRTSAEAKAVVLETRYQENKARGSEALEQGDYNGALGYFKLAKGFKDTQEIKDLIQQAEKKLKGAE